MRTFAMDNVISELKHNGIPYSIYEYEWGDVVILRDIFHSRIYSVTNSKKAGHVMLIDHRIIGHDITMTYEEAIKVILEAANK